MGNGRLSIRRGGIALLAPVGALVVATGLLTAGSVADAATFAGFAITFQAPDSRQWNIDPDGQAIRSPSALAPNTSPSIAGLVDGTYEEAFTAPDGTLWIVSSAGGGQQFRPCGSPFQLTPNTSPSIAALPGGGWHAAASQFMPNGEVLEIDSDVLARGSCSTSTPGSSAASSPDFVVLSNGSWARTFVGSDGLVRVRDVAGTRLVGNGLGVAPGTSPVIAADHNGGWKIAFQGGDHRLWTVNSTGNQVQWPDLLEPTSGVGIAALSTGGYEVVFMAAGDGLLRRMSPSGAVSLVANGLSMAAHTSPAIAADSSGGFEIAFHAAAADTVWIVDPGDTAHDTGLGIAAGTSPDITAMVRPPSPMSVRGHLHTGPPARTMTTTAEQFSASYGTPQPT